MQAEWSLYLWRADDGELDTDNVSNQRAATKDTKTAGNGNFAAPLHCFVMRRLEVDVDEASDRCAAFIADIAEVCKKHRVMMRLDEDEIESPVFENYPPAGGSGFGFILEAEDLEDAIRNAVWDVIHPSA